MLSSEAQKLIAPCKKLYWWTTLWNFLLSLGFLCIYCRPAAFGFGDLIKPNRERSLWALLYVYCMSHNAYWHSTQVVLKKQAVYVWQQVRQAEKLSLYVVLRLLGLQIGIHASGGGLEQCSLQHFMVWHACWCRKVFRRIIFRACCAFQAKYEFNFFVRMSALCVYVSVFLYLLEVHIVSAFRMILL